VDSWSGYNIENNAGQLLTTVVMYCNMPTQINFLTFGFIDVSCYIVLSLVVNDKYLSRF
jgi:hypothetical protein